MTAKEIFLEMTKPDGRPERQLLQYEALSLWLGDPVNKYLRANAVSDGRYIDRWGVTLESMKCQRGSLPVTTDELKVIKDITHWRDYVKAPDVEKMCADGWEESAMAARETCGPDRLLCGFSGTGLFEQCHYLMGFADTLTNLYEHPTEMHELIDYLCEHKLKVVKLLCEGLHPDGVFLHDDWGTRTQLFMRPEMWREFYKEPYRRIYGYLRSQGLATIHHGDSYMAPIVEDMAEIGIQCWQGVLPENDIPELQHRLRGSMILMGGIGAVIDRPDSTEEEIRAHVRNALESYCPGGHFIPSITYGLAGAIYSHVDPIIDDEIRKYNEALHLPRHAAVQVRRRAAASAAQNDAKENGRQENSLARLSAALVKGRKKAVVQLTEQALSEGRDAELILSEGLIAGMNRLGEDFSAGKAFVPEMLMAAKCMNEAMALLKGALTGGVSHMLGRAVMGTVKGDHHDIGKNIVKIMFEGSGIEVIDLGVDVPAERFVAVAKEQDCDIIAASSLLTTCIDEMRLIVEQAEAAGIRDRVRIMVGGAAVTQTFCDRIGADSFTEDAAGAARAAVEMLKKIG